MTRPFGVQHLEAQLFVFACTVASPRASIGHRLFTTFVIFDISSKPNTNCVSCNAKQRADSFLSPSFCVRLAAPAQSLESFSEK
jgi:hypothetical protein